VGLGRVVETGHQGVNVSVGHHLRSVEEQLSPPDQAGVLTEVADSLEKALENLDAQTLPDTGQAGVVGQDLVEGVAQIPAVGQIETGRLDQFPLGTDAFKEHDQLQLEENDRVDGGPAAFAIPLPGPVADEVKVKRGFKVTVEVAQGNDFLQGDSNWFVKAARLCGAEHGALQGKARLERTAVYRCAGGPRLFQQAGAF